VDSGRDREGLGWFAKGGGREIQAVGAAGGGGVACGVSEHGEFQDCDGARPGEGSARREPGTVYAGAADGEAVQ
jgi:hypothetical protein